MQIDKGDLSFASVVEREIKIDVNDSCLFERLTRTSTIGSFNLIKDTYFDLNNHSLLETDEVLRIRQINDSYFLAYKGKRTISNSVIRREEYEVSVDNHLIYTIIQRFFSPRDIVEKRRAVVVDSKFSNLTIYYDIYPFIGNYIEVEGDAEVIGQYVNHYSVPSTALEKRNCTEIFVNYCDENSLCFDNVRYSLTFSSR